ncbi:MAG: hypothetical protein HY392_00915 [Candidatus Diapherotrites archaeon]|nr:hypothetical protein [Candidatus Diapherotrites archaeon]
MDKIWAILLIVLGIIGALFGANYLIDNLGQGGPDSGLNEPEKATVTLDVDKNPFNPSRGEKIKITVKTDKAIDANIYLAYSDQPGTPNHLMPLEKSLVRIPANTESEGYQIEWDGTDSATGKLLRPGSHYKIAVKEETKNNDGAYDEKNITISGIIEGYDRTALLENWQEKIEIGFTEQTPAGTYKKTLINPQDPPLETNFFPVPATEDVDIFFPGYPELGKIGFEVRPVPGTDELFELEMTLDYSDYFKREIIEPQTIKGQIEIQFGLPYDSPPPIELVIHLNESGAILYKTGSTELGEYLAQLSGEKGWGLIPITDGTPQAIQEEILRQYRGEKVEIPLALTIGPFKNLLLIGWHDSIPFYDETGVLGKNDKEEFDEERILDQVYYGNIDDDPFVELSVGRIPFSGADNLRAYFEAASKREPSEEPYIYVASNGPIYRQQDVGEFEGKNLDQQQLNNAFIRKQFLYTGYSPEFDDPSNGFFVDNVNAAVISGFRAIDDFTNCEMGDTESSSNYPTDFSFVFHKACDPIVTANFLSGPNIVVLTKKDAFEDTVKSYIYSTLSQKIPGRFKAGDSFKDYINLAVASEFNEAEKYYALYGDPSNIVRTNGALFDPNKRVKMNLEGEEITLEMPRLDPNDFFSLGKDKPFSEKEIENIKAGNFAVADATILEKDTPFVTNATKRTPSETYVLVLDKDGYADNDEPYTELMLVTRTDQPQRQLSPMQEPQDIYQKDTQKGFKFPEFKRAAIEIWRGATHAEVLEGLIDGTYAGKTQVNGVEYDTYMVELSGNIIYTESGEAFYPGFLDSSGTVEITQNKDNSLNFEVTLSSLEKTKNAQESNVTLNPKHLRFDSYKLVFENQKTGATDAEPLYSGLSKTSETITKGPLPDSKVSGFDTISLYGEKSSFGSFDFMGKPILSARIRDDEGNLLLGQEIEMQNTLGFLNYPNSTVTLELYNRQNEEGYSEVLFKITGVDDLSPLAENKVILLQTTDDSPNKGMITPSVTQAVRKILEEKPTLKEKFPDPKNVLLLDGDWAKVFFGHFVEGAYFFSNRLTLVPFSYGLDKDFDSVKNAFLNADFANSDYEGKKLFRAKTASGTEFEIDAGLGFLTGGTYVGDDQKQDEQSDSRFYFQFDLEDLFTLMKEGAGEGNYYTLSIDGFKDGFEKPPAPEPFTGPPDFIGPPSPEEEIEQEPVSVLIEQIFVGGQKIEHGETWNFRQIVKTGEEAIVVNFSTSIHPFAKAELFSGDEKLTERSFGDLSEAYEPGQPIPFSPIVKPLKELLNAEGKLALSVKVTDNESQTYQSKLSEIEIELTE